MSHPSAVPCNYSVPLTLVKWSQTFWCEQEPNTRSMELTAGEWPEQELQEQGKQETGLLTFFGFKKKKSYPFPAVYCTTQVLIMTTNAKLNSSCAMHFCKVTLLSTIVNTQQRLMYLLEGINLNTQKL